MLPLQSGRTCILAMLPGLRPLIHRQSTRQLLRHVFLMQDGEAQHMNISTSPEQQNQTITKLTLGPATSPAPKVHYESEEDDGSRDAFSLPAANAAAQPVPTLQANNGSLKRKQPLAGQERRVSLGSDGSSKCVQHLDHFAPVRQAAALHAIPAISKPSISRLTVWPC